eukprot:GILI01002270.1.p1 GENE.GILI01002270.1~~GILI01002270.1.p1  ORF type:complete len:201 (-),score=55.73 GILI01002270.1:245-781(-)
MATPQEFAEEWRKRVEDPKVKETLEKSWQSLMLEKEQLRSSSWPKFYLRRKWERNAVSSEIVWLSSKVGPTSVEQLERFGRSHPNAHAAIVNSKDNCTLDLAQTAAAVLIPTGSAALSWALTRGNIKKGALGGLLGLIFSVPFVAMFEHRKDAGAHATRTFLYWAWKDNLTKAGELSH